jgi:hypothetical protein
MLLLTSAPAFAQQDQGTITGRVRDSTGGALAAAAVTATSSNGTETRTSTNADGHYVLTALVIGGYQVTIEAPGFKRALSEPVEIHAGVRARVDVTLELGPLVDTVSVHRPAPLLQTETSSLSLTLGPAQIGELPVNGRNFSQLAMLAPGVLPAFGHVQRESGFNAHGQWALQNNFIL